MVSLEEELELSNIYANIEDVPAMKAASRRSVEDFKVPAAAPGMKMYRLVVVILGLLCILQAALIVYLISEQNSRTEERDNLKRINLDLEASGKNLTEERDDLKRTVKDYVSEQNSLIEERDELKRINRDMVATNKNLAKERDDLGRTLRAGGWKYFSGSLYTISSIKKNWQASRDDCLQKGADLVIVNSREEEKYITSFGERVWIGLTDRETEGRWKWVDGTPLTTRFTHYFTFLLSSYWYPGEPNGNSKLDEDCAQIFPANVGEGWLDYHCSYTTNGWICEKILP